MHLVAFYQSIAQNSLLSLNAVQDDVIAVANNRFLLGEPMNLYMAAGIGTTLDYAKILAPSFGPIANPYIKPTQRPAVGIPVPNVMDLRTVPFRLPAKEQFYVQALQSSAGAEIEAVLCLIGKGIQPAVPGNVFTIRGTSTTAAVAGSWTSVSVTWENDLEGGYYDLVGAYHISTTGIGCRWVSQYQVDQPGMISVRAESHAMPPIGQAFGLGQWLKFESDAFPVPKVLCSAADASHTFYMQVVKRS